MVPSEEGGGPAAPTTRGYLATVTTAKGKCAFILDHTGRVIGWGAAAGKLLGYFREQIVGRLARDLLPPDEAHATGEQVAQVLNADGRYAGSLVLVDVAGSQVQANVEIVAFYPPEKSTLAAAAVGKPTPTAEALEQALGQREREWFIHIGLHGLLQESPSLQVLLERALAIGAEAVNSDVTLLFLMDEDKSGLRLAASAGLPEEMKELLAQHSLGPGGISVAKATALTGEPQIVDDYSTHPMAALMQGTLVEGLPLAVVSVPCAVGEEVVGVFQAARYGEWPDKEKEAALLQGFGMHVADAIQRKRAETTADLRMAQMQALLAAARAVTESLDLETVLASVLFEALKVVPLAEAGAIFLYEEQQGVLRARAGCSLNWEPLSQLRLLPGEGTTGHAFARDHSVCLSGQVTEALDKELRDENRTLWAGACDNRPVTSAVAVPLRGYQKSLGTLSLYNFSFDQPLSPEVIPVVEAFAQHAVLAMRNAEAHAAVARAYQYWEGLVSAAGDAVVSVDNDLRIVTFNPGAAKMFGYRPEEMVGQHLSAIVPKGHWEPIEQAARRVKEGASVLSVEGVIRRRDRVLLPVSITASPVRDRQGNIIGLMGIARDLTPRKRLEHELRWKAQRLEALVEAGTAISSCTAAQAVAAAIVNSATRAAGVGEHAALYLFDPKQSVLVEQASSWKAESSSLAPRQLAPGEGPEGRAFLTRQAVIWQGDIASQPSPFHSTSATVTEENATPAIGRKALCWAVCVPLLAQQECLGVLAAYSTRPQDGEVLPDKTEVALLELFASQATTALQNARLHEDVQRAKEYWENLIGEAGDAVIAVDIQHRITSWNRGAERMLGHAAEAAMGQPVDSITSPRQAAELVSLIESALGGEPVVSRELALSGAAGEVWSSLSVSPLRDRQGTIIGAAIFAKDISARVAAEELAQARARETGILLQAAKALASRLDVWGVFDTIVEEAVKVIPGAQAGLLHLYEEHSGMLEPHAAVGVLRAAGSEMVVAPGEGPMGEAFSTRQTVVRSAVRGQLPLAGTSDKALVAWRAASAYLGEAQCAVCAPVCVGDQALGVLSVFCFAPGCEVGAESGRLLAALADHAALAVRNARLHWELEGTKAYWERVVQCAGDAIIAADTDRLVTLWNPAAEKLFGYTREQILGRPVALLVPPDRSGEADALKARMMGGEGVVTYETVRLSATGERLDVLLTLAPFWGAEGQVTGWVGVFRDIRERKRLEEEISRRAKRQAALNRIAAAAAESLELVPMLESTLDRILTAANMDAGAIQLPDETGEWLRLVAISGPDETLAQAVNRVPVASSLGGTAFRSGQPVVAERYSDHAEAMSAVAALNVGTCVFIPLRAHGRILGVLALGTVGRTRHIDPEEQEWLIALGDHVGLAIGNVLAYQEEREKATRLEAVAAIVRTVGSTWDLQDILDKVANEIRRVVPCQRISMALYEQERDALVLHAISSERPPVVLARGAELVSPSMATVRAYRSQRTCYQPDLTLVDDGAGSALVAEGIRSAVCVPLLVGNECLGTVNFGRGMTSGFSQQDIRLLEELAAHLAIAVYKTREHLALEEAYAHLTAAQASLAQSEKMAGIGMLAAGVAHEFNNLLAVMHGYAELALQEGDVPTAKEALEAVIANSKRAAEITRNLLSFARARSQEKEPLDLREVLELVLSLVERDLEKSRIQVVKHYQTDVPFALANRAQMQQVFLNLLTNARQAMTTGGTLTLEVAEAAHRESGLRTVQVSVADTGQGIPAEHLGRIFEPFFTTRGALGLGGAPATGLGLPVVYGILKAQGGSIWAESEPGKGTEFTLQVPAA